MSPSRVDLSQLEGGLCIEGGRNLDGAISDTTQLTTPTSLKTQGKCSLENYLGISPNIILATIQTQTQIQSNIEQKEEDRL